MGKPARHISIEGFDGVGKTTTCQLLAEKLGYEFVEKPLHYLFDEGDSFNAYLRIRDIVNACPDRDFTASFYGLGSLYLYYLYQGKNIVTDRHLCSNYAWSGVDGNEDVYDLLLKKLGKPYLTVVLYAKPETIQTRLGGRDCHDPDLKKIRKSEHIYEKMRRFCVEKGLNTLWLCTDNLSPEKVVELILERIQDMEEGDEPAFHTEALVGVKR